MEAPFTSDGLVTRGGKITRGGPRTANTNLWTGSLRVTGSSTCERDMHVWTGPVLVKDPPPVNETSTCQWNEMSTCEWIFDKRLKFHRWFLHVLTRHNENYTCRLKLNPFFFFFCYSQIECGAPNRDGFQLLTRLYWMRFCEALTSIILHKSWYLSKCQHQRPPLILSRMLAIC